MDNKINSIILKNIDLTGISIEEQELKVKEEIYEFEMALNDFKRDSTSNNRKHLIEEYYDYMQSPLGLLEMVGISAEEVMKSYPIHEKKILNRPRKKECSKCINKSGYCLYRSRFFQGEHEAETCKIYKELEE